MTSVISPGLQERLGRLGILAPVDPEAITRWLPAPRMLDLHGKGRRLSGEP